MAKAPEVTAVFTARYGNNYQDKAFRIIEIKISFSQTDSEILVTITFALEILF